MMDEATRRSARRMVRIAQAMNRPRELAALIGEEKAREIAERQHEVASKVHRSPPKCLDGMRF
jgi:hypothetical protein